MISQPPPSLVSFFGKVLTSFIFCFPKTATTSLYFQRLIEQRILKWIYTLEKSIEVISQSATEKGANDTRSVCGGKIKEHDSVVLKFSSDVVFWGPKLNCFNRKVKFYVNGSAEENVFSARTLEKRIELIKKQTQLTSLIFYFNASTDGEISEIVTKLARTCPLVSVFLHLYR